MALAITGDQFLIDELVPLLRARARRLRTGTRAEVNRCEYYKGCYPYFHYAILTMPQLPRTRCWPYETNCTRPSDLTAGKRTGQKKERKDYNSIPPSSSTSVTAFLTPGVWQL